MTLRRPAKFALRVLEAALGPSVVPFAQLGVGATRCPKSVRNAPKVHLAQLVLDLALIVLQAILRQSDLLFAVSANQDVGVE
jgi:hypothetical protein